MKTRKIEGYNVMQGIMKEIRALPQGYHAELIFDPTENSVRVEGCLSQGSWLRYPNFSNDVFVCNVFPSDKWLLGDIIRAVCVKLENMHTMDGSDVRDYIDTFIAQCR